VLAFLDRRRRGLAEGRLGSAYVVAAASSILLLSKNRYAEVGWLDLMKGEIITVDNVDLILTGASLAVVVVALALFHRELLLVSFDRAMAITLGKNVVAWDALLYLLIGLTGLDGRAQRRPAHLLWLPADPGLDRSPLCRQHAPVHYLRVSSPAGRFLFVGFCIAYRYDLPVGPADVVLLGVIYGLAFLARKFFRLIRGGGVRRFD